MIDPPHITQTVARPTAIIHIVVPSDQIQDVMGPTLQELITTLGEQGVKPAGPWFTHHLRRPSESFDFEVSMPVDRPVKPSGRVQPSQWPEMKVARTVYHGDYDDLGEAWSDLLDWVEENGHQPRQDLWEVYTIGPDTSSNPADWRTELNQPLL